MELSFGAGAVCDNILYFSDATCNALMKLNLLDGHLSYITSFPDEEEKFYIHKQCVKNADKLYFIPNTGYNIHIYDLKSGDVSWVHVNRCNSTRLVFNGGVILDDKLWVVPCDISQELICLDISTRRVNVFPSLEKDLKSYVSNFKQPFWKYCVFEKKMYIALLKTNKIAKYDFENFKMEIIETEIESIDAIYRSRDTFWLCTVDGRVYLWEEKINKCVSVVLEDDENNGGAYSVSESLMGEVYLIPSYGRQIMKRRLDNVFKGNDEFFINSKELEIKGVNYEFYDVSANKIFLFPICGSNVVVLKDTGVSIVEAILDGGDDIYFSKKNRALNNELNHNVYYEGRSIGLECYINALLDR